MRTTTAAMLAMVAGPALLATGCPGPQEPAGPPPDLVPQVRQLAERINDGDLEGALALFSEDAHWEFPQEPDFTVERKSFTRAWSLDRSLHVRLELEDCTQEDLTVTCTVIENNDWLQLHGLRPWKGRNTRFVFDDQGRIRRVIWGEHDKEMIEQLRPLWRAFAKWARENHPDEFEKMVVPGEKRLRWSAETGELMMRLGREWVEAGRPGLEEARRRMQEQQERKRGDGPAADPER